MRRDEVASGPAAEFQWPAPFTVPPPYQVSIAFNLLNNFIARMNQAYQAEFQMIVFEHVPRETFKDMTYVNILPEFRNGEPLIPQDWQS